jgi:hypothetical protein
MFASKTGKQFFVASDDGDAIAFPNDMIEHCPGQITAGNYGQPNAPPSRQHAEDLAVANAEVCVSVRFCQARYLRPSFVKPDHVIDIWSDEVAKRIPGQCFLDP